MFRIQRHYSDTLGFFYPLAPRSAHAGEFRAAWANHLAFWLVIAALVVPTVGAVVSPAYWLGV